MNEFSLPSTCLISTHVQHRVTTLAIRDDMLVWVRKGCKTLINPGGALKFETGSAMVLMQGSQWDVINDPSRHGRYEALVLQFGREAIREFHDRHAAELSGPGVDTCFRLEVNPELADSLERAAGTLNSPAASLPLQRHRVQEVLLLLAERGCFFGPGEELTWPDRVRRAIGQRPHAMWSVDILAQVFHVSQSTLRRRLSACGTTAGELVREVRLEAALLLLQSTSLSVSEVAERCGYESHSRFSAVFRSRYGFAPSYLRAESDRGGKDMGARFGTKIDVNGLTRR